MSSYEEYKAWLSAKNDEEVVDAFNKQVGNHGWTSSRANYLAALHDELERRFDYSAVGDKGALSLRDKVKLVGRKLVLAGAPNPYAGQPVTNPFWEGK